MLNQVILGIGSNIDPEKHIPKAISAISKLTKLVKRSTIIQTKALEVSNQPDFLNTVLLVQTNLELQQLKHALKKLEQDLGRIKTEDKNGPRIIDCDILLWNKVIVDQEVYKYPFLRDLLKQIEPQIEIILNQPDLLPHNTDNTHTTGILLVNLGTPDSFKPWDIFRFLRAFLSDPFVIGLPRLVWLPLLYGIILPLRSISVARKYAKIWTDQGSPLAVNSHNQLIKMRALLKQTLKQNPDKKQTCHVELAMTYSKPSIAEAMQKFADHQVRKILVLPLYPQYSYSTHVSIFHQVNRLAEQWRWLPQIQFINGYYDHPQYINACCEAITKHWEAHGKAEKLIFSFHGLPEKANQLGDPYQKQSYQSAHLIAEQLQLDPESWMVSFQSRFGPAAWLTPYTDQSLVSLAQAGVKRVQLFCPGFSADCLETLEENAKENKKIFFEAGGEHFEYIAALNDADAHIELMKSLVETYLESIQKYRKKAN